MAITGIVCKSLQSVPQPKTSQANQRIKHPQSTQQQDTAQHLQHTLQVSCYRRGLRAEFAIC